MSTLSPSDGPFFPNDVNVVSLPEPGRSQRYTEAGLPQNALDSAYYASCCSPFDDSPAYRESAQSKESDIRDNTGGRYGELCDSPNTMWSPQIIANTVSESGQSNADCSASQDHYISQIANGFTGKWIEMQPRRNNSTKASPQYSSSVPDPPKIPIPFVRSSRTNPQPLTELHICQLCSKSFTLRKDRDRHVASKHTDRPPYLCPIRSCSFASRGFPRKDKAVRHIKTRHSEYPDIKPRENKESGNRQQSPPRRSSLGYTYTNPSRSGTASSLASLQDGGSVSEMSSYGSPPSSVTEPDILLGEFGHYLLGSDDRATDHINHKYRFGVESESVYSDLDKIQAQLELEMRYDHLGQGTYSNVLEGLDDMKDTVNFDGLIEDFTESNSGDDVNFPIKAKNAQSAPANVTDYEKHSPGTYHYTF